MPSKEEVKDAQRGDIATDQTKDESINDIGLQLSSKVPNSFFVDVENEVQPVKVQSIAKIIDRENSRAKKAAIDAFTRAEWERVSHQKGLIVAIVGLTAVQLVFFNVIIACVLHSSFKQGERETIDNLFLILKYYVGATVAELIGMVAFIARGTFSSDHIKVMKFLFAEKEKSERENLTGDEEKLEDV